MEAEDYPLYNVHRAGLMEDMRKNTSNELSAVRESALNDMINLILNHKKEITKVPLATTLEGARKWVAKRPKAGYRVDHRDIGGDPEKEVVVYDRAGRPFMVNGYKLKPSDYGLRKAYFEANPKSEDRAGNPMRKWAQDYAWNSVEDKDNKWNRLVSKNVENYEKMKSWGYRMPTKPKTQITPYSIFSKLISPLVKYVLEGADGGKLYDKFKVAFEMPDAEPGPSNYAFLSKIVSPIAIYRFLYMRFVEQKYYFSLKKTAETEKLVSTYESFKRYMNKNKATFRKWFMENVLDKKKKYADFASGWINDVAVLNNLVKNDIQLDGSDIQDGIVFLLGVKNFGAVITFKDAGGDGIDKEFTFRELLVDNAKAEDLMDQLNDKHGEYYREVKRAIERFKKVAQKSMDDYFKNDKVKRKFFEDKGAFETFEEAVERGVPNAVDEDDAEEQLEAGASPIKKPPAVSTTEADEGQSGDNAEFAKFDDEEEKPDPKQRKITEFYEGE